MLIKKFDLNFIVGSFKDNVKYLRILLDQKKSLIFLPCSLNDLERAEKKILKTSYKQIDYCTADGMPLVFYFRYLQKKGRLDYENKIERTYGPDLMRTILNTDNKHRHFFCGSSQETIKKLEKQLLKNNNQLKIAGSYSPPFASAQEISIQLIKKIKKCKTDVIWLGISSPKQVELANLLKKQELNLKIFCVGAAFDFLAGTKKQAPLYWQKSGFEWFYRLIHEPKRLGKRYLVDIPFFLTKKIIQEFF